MVKRRSYNWDTSTKSVDPTKYTEGDRFPISKMTHRNGHSYVLEHIQKESDLKLILYSDGKLEIDSPSKLLNPKAMQVVNVSEASSVVYSGGRYKNRVAYKLFTLISVIASIMTLIAIPLFVDMALNNYSPSPEEYLIFLGPIIWITFDVSRGRMSSPEKIQFNFSDGSSKEIHGDLPDSNLHKFSAMMIFFGVFVGIIIALEWAMIHAPLVGDIFGWACLGIIGLYGIYWVVNLFTSQTELAGIDSADIPNGVTHMYFASLSLRNSTPSLQLESDMTAKELESIRERLLRHEAIISSIVSTSDIFQAPSPSLGVLAIRVSTETLMRHACDNVGIAWKPNARPTLDVYVQRYGSTKQLDSRVRSYLDNIRAMGNRAAHDFNLDWDEFKITLNQFCEIVSWYSDSFDSNDESE